MSHSIFPKWLRVLVGCILLGLLVIIGEWILYEWLFYNSEWLFLLGFIIILFGVFVGLWLKIKER